MKSQEMKAKTKRKYIGKAEGDALVEWLNDNEHRNAGKQVMHLMRDLEMLDQEFDKESRLLWDKKFVEARRSATGKATIGTKDLRINRKYKQIARSVDRLLARCSMRPRLTHHGRRMLHKGT